MAPNRIGTTPQEKRQDGDWTRTTMMMKRYYSPSPRLLRLLAVLGAAAADAGPFGLFSQRDTAIRVFSLHPMAIVGAAAFTPGTGTVHRQGQRIDQVGVVRRKSSRSLVARRHLFFSQGHDRKICNSINQETEALLKLHAGTGNDEDDRPALHALHRYDASIKKRSRRAGRRKRKRRSWEYKFRAAAAIFSLVGAVLFSPALTPAETISANYNVVDSGSAAAAKVQQVSTTATATSSDVSDTSSTANRISVNSRTSGDRRQNEIDSGDDDDDDDRPPVPKKLRYYTIMHTGTPEEIAAANEALLDHAVGIISSLYYDKTAGAYFTPRDLYDRWRALRAYAKDGEAGLTRLRLDDSARGEHRLSWMKKSNSNGANSVPPTPMPEDVLGSRENVVKGLKWIVSTLDDPFSVYLTREELWDEIHGRQDGFLGTGAIVEVPRRISPTTSWFQSSGGDPLLDSSLLRKVSSTDVRSGKTTGRAGSQSVLSRTRVDNNPIITAIVPASPAERAGLSVGDRILAVGSDKFVGNREKIEQKLMTRYKAKNYIGYPDVTIAKPVVKSMPNEEVGQEGGGSESSSSLGERQRIAWYRKIRVSVPTALVEPFHPFSPQPLQESFADASSAPTPMAPIVSGGNSIVYYQMLNQADSIFRRVSADELGSPSQGGGVGYIRMTRFSRSATAGFTSAVSELEAAGAQSYILDLRNCYGGVIQEAMLTASSLLRDPKSVLCYTIDARGGFTPHIVEDFVTDPRYPGYLLSHEASTVTLDQVKRARAGGVRGDDDDSSPQDGRSILWVPSTSYVSLHEQSMKKGLHREASASLHVSSSAGGDPPVTYAGLKQLGGVGTRRLLRTREEQLAAQKKLVILVNEGTASSAEMFTAALADNGRTVALVGRRTYGKGLIQHTVPLPDGGALRLTIAEYLTPKLKHVTNIGRARYDPSTGELVGGGIRPDVSCPSSIGIPSNAGADICVGIALDALENSDAEDEALNNYNDLPSSVTVASQEKGDSVGLHIARLLHMNGR